MPARGPCRSTSAVVSSSSPTAGLATAGLVNDGSLRRRAFETESRASTLILPPVCARHRFLWRRGELRDARQPWRYHQNLWILDPPMAAVSHPRRRTEEPTAVAGEEGTPIGASSRKTTRETSGRSRTRSAGQAQTMRGAALEANWTPPSPRPGASGTRRDTPSGPGTDTPEIGWSRSSPARVRSACPTGGSRREWERRGSSPLRSSHPRSSVPEKSEVLLVLSLHGLSAGEVAPALEAVFGSSVGPSSVITRRRRSGRT